MLLINRRTIEKLNHQILLKYRRSAFCLTLLLAICGLLCLLFPIYAGVALSYLTGFLLSICGLFTFIFAYTFRKNGKLAIFCMIIFGMIYVGIGISVFLSPILGINILSATICFLLLLAGISRMSAAFKNAHMVGRYWCMIIGLMDIFIAFMWMGANENTTYMLTSLFIGLEMISSACIYFSLSRFFKKFSKLSTNDKV